MSSVDRGGAHHPVIELTLTRVREFVREPEALFWTFLFPIVMSIVMAFAFPSRTAQPVPVGVAGGADAASIRQALANAPGVRLKDIPAGQEQRALREGEVHVIVVPTTPPTYRFDAARAESHTARLVVDDALKRAAGRVDPWVAREEGVQVPGIALRRLAHPRAGRDGDHEQRHVGRGVLDRPGADAEAAEADDRQPDAEARVPVRPPAGAPAVPRARGRRCRSGSGCSRSGCRSTEASARSWP